MSKLNEANDRLDVAIARLEKAVEARRMHAPEAGDASRETEELQGEFDRLRADFATLRETSGTVSSRLDVAIGRLRNMIDE